MQSKGAIKLVAILLLLASLWQLSFTVVSNRYEKKAEKYDALCELVEALREANEVDRDYIEEVDGRIDNIVHVLEELRK